MKKRKIGNKNGQKSQKRNKIAARIERIELNEQKLQKVCKQETKNPNKTNIVYIPCDPSIENTRSKCDMSSEAVAHTDTRQRPNHSVRMGETDEERLPRHCECPILPSIVVSAAYPLNLSHTQKVVALAAQLVRLIGWLHLESNPWRPILVDFHLSICWICRFVINETKEEKKKKKTKARNGQQWPERWSSNRKK